MYSEYTYLHEIISIMRTKKRITSLKAHEIFEHNKIKFVEVSLLLLYNRILLPVKTFHHVFISKIHLIQNVKT